MLMDFEGRILCRETIAQAKALVQVGAGRVRFTCDELLERHMARKARAAQRVQRARRKAGDVT
ncbi:MAG: hypothetical protein FWB91_02130 [Defluviitaleaceae bacterium]|nr:hypothetical protein [Defluviitaleaceae bacterium]